MKKILIGLLLLLSGFTAQAQNIQKLFTGEWVEKKSGRHLRIVWLPAWKLVEISDWQGDYYADQAMIDMYKASVQKNKLVMPEEKTEHRAPYAELVRSGDKPIYRWKAYGHPNGRFVDSAVFKIIKL